MVKKAPSVLFIISGSIAAEKALSAVRLLTKKKINITIVLTKNAEEFISAEQCEKVTGNKVYRELFASKGADKMDHINLSRVNDVIVVAPASANIIARMAQGQAVDLASTILLASDKPIMVAPAMNTKMWENKATMRNINMLLKDGVKFIGPAEGDLACGEIGLGRMKEADEIAAEVEAFFKNRNLLKGIKALVTSGPTHEQIDPVRFIGNYSSGKQGHAIAAKMAEMGADVTLVTGPVILPDPANVRTVKVKTAEQMLAACKKALPADVAVFAAAVADWRVEKSAKQKMKKSGTKSAELKLVQNPDILKTIATGKNRPKLVIGFAAETENLIKNAKAKLKSKGADWIVANDVSKNIFGSEKNKIALVDKKGIEKWQLLDKTRVAENLALRIAEMIKGEK